MGHAVGMLDVALLKGVVGWHRSMIGGSAGDGLGGVVGREGLSGGAGSPLEGVDGWHRSMIGGAAGDDLGGGVGGELGGVAVLGLPCGPWFADSGRWLAVLHVMAVVELLMVKD